MSLPDPATLLSLNRAGYSRSELAKRYGVTKNVITGKIDYYKRKLEESERLKRSRFEVDYGEPWTLAGDRLIVGDVHVPCIDYDFTRLVMIVARKLNIKSLLVGGDFFNFDFLSQYTTAVPLPTWSQEREAAKVLIEEWLDWFEHIDIIMGNHDRRLQYWAAGEFEESDLLAMITSSSKVRMSRWGWCIQTAQAEDMPDWRITHSKNYSINQLTVGDQLAQKFQQNVISHHEHHLAKGWDRYGRYVIINNGGLYDPKKLAYTVLDDNKCAAMVNGFTAIKDDVAQVFGKFPFTDWREWIN